MRTRHFDVARAINHVLLSFVLTPTLIFEIRPTSGLTLDRHVGVFVVVVVVVAVVFFVGAVALDGSQYMIPIYGAMPLRQVI